MYDHQKDASGNKYFPSEYFRGYGINKLLFTKDMMVEGAAADTIVLSHINLLPVGWMIKKLRPSAQLILLAHGIEIWYPIAKRKKRMLQSCDSIVCVSNHTKQQVVRVHGIAPGKCTILNNCLDPLLPVPSVQQKNIHLLKKYGLAPTDIIAMSLTRISSKERYKGYEKVIEAIASLSKQYKGIKYLIAGKYDAVEKKYLDTIIKDLGAEDTVIMPGFIANEELEDHFAISDMYVMPSRKEGFGIVFIEAMYYGLPVIAGNLDGSSDAVLDGELGQLVNPDNVRDISLAIANIIENKKLYMPLKKLLMQHFSYEAYKHKLDIALAGS